MKRLRFLMLFIFEILILFQVGSQTSTHFGAKQRRRNERVLNGYAMRRAQEWNISYECEWVKEPDFVNTPATFLEGRSLTVAFGPYKPFAWTESPTENVSIGDNVHHLDWQGYSVKVIDLVAEEAGFNYTIVWRGSKDDAQELWGAQDYTELAVNAINVFNLIGSFWVDNSMRRAAGISISHHFVDSSGVLMTSVSEESEKSHMDAIVLVFKPFTPGVWGTLLALLFVKAWFSYFLEGSKSKVWKQNRDLEPSQDCASPYWKGAVVQNYMLEYATSSQDPRTTPLAPIINVIMEEISAVKHCISRLTVKDPLSLNTLSKLQDDCQTHLKKLDDHARSIIHAKECLPENSKEGLCNTCLARNIDGIIKHSSAVKKCISQLTGKDPFSFKNISKLHDSCQSHLKKMDGIVKKIIDASEYKREKSGSAETLSVKTLSAKSTKEEKSRASEKLESLKRFLHALDMSFSHFTATGQALESGNTHDKLHNIVWGFLVVVVLAAYTANLATVLISESASSGTLSSLEEARYQKVKICVERGSVYENWLESNYAGLNIHALESSNALGDAVAEGSCAGAFLGKSEANMAEVLHPNQLTIVDSYFTSGGGFALSPYGCGSLILAGIDVALLELDMNGKLEEVWEEELIAYAADGAVLTDESQTEDYVIQLTIEDLGGIFIIYGIALVTLALSHFCFLLRCKQSTIPTVAHHQRDGSMYHITKQESTPLPSVELGSNSHVDARGPSVDIPSDEYIPRNSWSYSHTVTKKRKTVF